MRGRISHPHKTTDKIRKFIPFCLSFYRLSVRKNTGKTIAVGKDF
jgi:hypothetical protein